MCFVEDLRLSFPFSNLRLCLLEITDLVTDNGSLFMSLLRPFRSILVRYPMIYVHTAAISQDVDLTFIGITITYVIFYKLISHQFGIFLVYLTFLRQSFLDPGCMC